MLPPSCSLSHSFALFSSVIQFGQRHQCTYTHIQCPWPLLSWSSSPPPAGKAAPGNNVLAGWTRTGMGWGPHSPAERLLLSSPKLHQGPLIMGRGARLWVRKSPNSKYPLSSLPSSPDYSTKTPMGLRGTSSFSPPPLLSALNEAKLSATLQQRSSNAPAPGFFFQEFTLGDCREEREREREREKRSVSTEVFSLHFSLYLRS